MQGGFHSASRWTGGERRIRICGHFGEWIQGRLGPDGPVALVSLPCPALAVTGRFRPARSLSVQGAGPLPVTPDEARRFLGQLGLPARGRFFLRPGMELGGGAGSSTAALVALAGLAGYGGDALGLARAAVASEGASDPLMFTAPDRLLWASREGRILGRAAPPPPADVIGGFFGPPRRTDPADGDFPDIIDLWGDWQAASAARDLPRLARLASLSALRSAARRSGGQDPTPDLAHALGALGHVAAHTGSARGLVFAPGTVPAHATEALREAGFRAVLSFRTSVSSPRRLRTTRSGGF